MRGRLIVRVRALLGLPLVALGAACSGAGGEASIEPEASAAPRGLVLLTVDGLPEALRQSPPPGLEASLVMQAASNRASAAHSSLLTGVHPGVHGVEVSGQGRGRALHPELPTLAELLRAAGWEAAAFTDGGAVAAELGFARGFEPYDEADGDPQQALGHAQAWIEQRVGAGDQGEPWFVWIRSRPVPGGSGYASLLARLREHVASGEVLLVLTSACELAGESSSARRSFDRPLLVATDTAVVSPRPVQAVDLVPTLLELCGVEAPEHLQGRSFAAALAGEPMAWDPTWSVLDLPEGVGAAVRWGRYRMLAWPSGPAPVLYDFATDPGEQINSIEAHPELAMHISEWMYARADEDASLAARFPAAPVQLTPDSLARLAAQGE